MLTRKLQIQAIVDRLSGTPVNDVMQKRSIKFAEPFKSIWKAMDAAVESGNPISDAVITAIENDSDRDKLMAEIFYSRPGDRGRYRSLFEEGPELPPIQWLWKKWIALGMLNLMGAQPGVGKSFASLDLCKKVIHGERWPDGTENETAGQKHNVIYVDAENVPSILHQRAQVMGLDERNLYSMRPDDTEIVLDFSTLPNQEKLINMVAFLQPRLIVVDSVSTIFPRGENNIEDVRMTLSFLNGVAREFNVAMLLIHHLRKHGQQMSFLDLSIDDFRGSGHIVAMARSVIGISVVQTTSVEEKNAPRKFQIMKTNISDYPDPLGYTIRSVDADGGAMLYWDIAAPKVYKEPTIVDECREWLEDYLKEEMAGKPVAPKDVVKAASEQGISRASVFRARKELRAHIKNTEGRRASGNCWQWSETVVQYDEKDDEDSESQESQ
jgi:hypothetical protein